MVADANTEIERKWLVARSGVVPEGCLALMGRYNLERNAIHQGYFYGLEVGNSVRIRKSTSGNAVKCFVTAKSGTSGSDMVRREYENEIFEECFNALWPLTEGRRIEKTRHSIPYGEHTVELDVFEGRLAGLVIVEVEFKGETEARAFEAPNWFGQEVTDDPRYKNHALASKQAVPTLMAATGTPGVNKDGGQT